MALSLPIFRRTAPNFTRPLFQCSNYRRLPRVATQPDLLKQASPKHIRAFQSSTKRASSAASGTFTPENGVSSPLSFLGKSTGKNPNKTKRGFFPKTSEKSVAYWLLGSAASVFGIVVFGGLTRLTESGYSAFSRIENEALIVQSLSITEWKPVTGSLPPTSEENWESEFNKYRSSPEFKMLNPNMTLSEFKSIYYMEWTHRLWGRFVGLSFAIPAVYFIARGKVSRPMALRITGIAGLIGFQGVLGWWMVQSGLKDDLFATGSPPRVSQYRLVAHLGTAFLCYSAMLWNGLSILRTHKLLHNPPMAEATLSRLRDPNLRIFRSSVGALAVLVFITAMSGGLVAGLDAGLIYNDFPYMGVGLTPPKSELFSDFYSHTPDSRDMWWRNILENPSLVQLDHRILATTTFTSVMALWAYSRFSRNVRTLLPIPVRKGVHGVVGFVFLQAVLGISTLIYLVPLPLASAHQAGSLALLSYVLLLGSRIWVPNRRVSTLLAKRIVTAKTNTKRPIQPNLHLLNQAQKAAVV